MRYPAALAATALLLVACEQRMPTAPISRPATADIAAQAMPQPLELRIDPVANISGSFLTVYLRLFGIPNESCVVEVRVFSEDGTEFGSGEAFIFIDETGRAHFSIEVASFRDWRLHTTAAASASAFCFGSPPRTAEDEETIKLTRT